MMKRKDSLDAIFAWWFGLEAAFMTITMFIAFWRYPHGDGYIAGMIFVYIFLPALALYLVYLLVVFVFSWKQTKSLQKVWEAMFGTVWAKRCAVAFGVAVLATFVCFAALAVLFRSV